MDDAATDTAPADPDPPPAGPPPSARPERRLSRSRDDRIVAGVCGGIARHFAIDPLWVRIGTVVLTLTGGTGVVLYLLGWLLLPEDGGSESVGRSVLSGRSSARLAPLAGIGLVAIGLAMVFDGIFWWDGHIVGPVLLIGLGLALLLRPGTRTDTDTGEESSDRPFELAPPPPAVPPGTPRRGRDRSRRASSMTLGVLCVGAGLIGIVLAAGASVSIQGAFAAGLLVAGAGLAVTAWYGRGRGLVWLGLLLLGGMSVGSLVDVPLEGGVGERHRTPRTLAELDEEYRLAVGELTLDLTRVPFDQGHTSVEASVAFGSLVVYVPGDVEVDVDARAGGGEVDLFGRVEEGGNITTSGRAPGPEGAGHLSLDLEVGFGAIEVVERG